MLTPNASGKMPPLRRHLLALTLCIPALLALGQAGLGQSRDKAPPSLEKTPGKPAVTEQAPPRPPISTPGAELVLILIRSTLLTLNDALRSGNYSVLRDLAAPSFQRANSAGQLYQIFANLTAQKVDLGAVAILAPQLPETPRIDQNGRLAVGGYFPGEPVQIHFGMLFEAVDHRWRLLSLSVNPVRSSAFVLPAGPQAAAPAKGK